MDRHELGMSFDFRPSHSTPCHLINSGPVFTARFLKPEFRNRVVSLSQNPIVRLICTKHCLRPRAGPPTQTPRNRTKLHICISNDDARDQRQENRVLKEREGINGKRGNKVASVRTRHVYNSRAAARQAQEVRAALAENRRLQHPPPTL